MGSVALCGVVRGSAWSCCIEEPKTEPRRPHQTARIALIDWYFRSGGDWLAIAINLLNRAIIAEQKMLHCSSHAKLENQA